MICSCYSHTMETSEHLVCCHWIPFLPQKTKLGHFKPQSPSERFEEGHTKSQQRDHIPGFLTCCPDLLLNQNQASVNGRKELIISAIQTKWKQCFCYVGWIIRFKRKKELKIRREIQLTAINCLFFKCAFPPFFFFFLYVCDGTGMFERH